MGETAALLFYINKNLKITQKSLLLEAEAEKLKKDLEETNSSLKDYKDKYELLREDNERLSNQLTKAQAQLESLKEEVSNLRDITAKIDEVKKILSERFSSTESILQAIKTGLDDSQKETILKFSKVLDEISSLKRSRIDSANLGSIDLGEIVVEKQKKSLEGKILSVDNEYKLAIINVGEKQNIEPQCKFEIYRNSQKIGTLQVKEVYPFMSLCDIQESSLKVKSGDKVVLSEEN